MNMHPPSLPAGRAARRGFTLLEVLFVVLIIMTLVALLLPAIQAAREQARRLSCAHKLGQIGLALAQYESAHGVLPPGVVNDTGPIRNQPEGYHMSWIVQMLPFIEEGARYRQVDFSVGVYEPANDAVRDTQISLLECPSDWSMFQMSQYVAYASSYAGCHHHVEAPIDDDNQGVFFLNSRVKSKAIPDGAACTLFVGEKKTDDQDRGWMSGTRATLRNTGLSLAETGRQEVQQPAGPRYRPSAWGMGYAAEADTEPRPSATAARVKKDKELAVGGFGSYHTGVTNFLLGDGSVHALADTIDTAVYQQLANRADGQLLRYRPE